MASPINMYKLQNKLAASKKQNAELVEQLNAVMIANGKLKLDVQTLKRSTAMTESQLGGMIQQIANRDKNMQKAKKYIIMQRREIGIMNGFIRNCCGSLDVEFES